MLAGIECSVSNIDNVRSFRLLLKRLRFVENEFLSWISTWKAYFFALATYMSYLQVVQIDNFTCINVTLSLFFYSCIKTGFQECLAIIFRITVFRKSRKMCQPDRPFCQERIFNTFV